MQGGFFLSEEVSVKEARVFDSPWPLCFAQRRGPLSGWRRIASPWCGMQPWGGPREGRASLEPSHGVLWHLLCVNNAPNRCILGLVS